MKQKYIRAKRIILGRPNQLEGFSDSTAFVGMKRGARQTPAHHGLSSVQLLRLMVVLSMVTVTSPKFKPSHEAKTRKFWEGQFKFSRTWLLLQLFL